MENLSALLKELERQQFYGSLEVKFEAGTVVLVRKTETIKPTIEGYRDNRGETNAKPRIAR
jgi:hypothetical protein